MLVNLQPVVEPTALGVVVAQQLQRLDVGGVALDESRQKVDFDIEIALLLVRKRLSFSCQIRHYAATIIGSL